MTDFEQKRTFSSNLARLLETRKLTQREVAESIGVSAQTFNTWYRGIAIPRMDKIQRLADYFHVEKSALIDPFVSSASHTDILTASEQALLSDFRLLNEEGQEMALEHISFLASRSRYKKRDQHELVDEA